MRGNPNTRYLYWASEKSKWSARLELVKLQETDGEELWLHHYETQRRPAQMRNWESHVALKTFIKWNPP
jgi:hypothetical protein